MTISRRHFQLRHHRQDKGIAIPEYILRSKSDSEHNAIFDMLSDLGMSWVRSDIYWSAVEQAQGIYDWTSVDRIVNAANARGIHFLPVIHTTPPWLRPVGQNDIYGPTSVAEQDAYAAFAAICAQRYLGRVSVYEIWNEPNLNQFWAPTPSSASYASLIIKASQTIKAVSPSLRVMMGGTGGASGVDSDIDAAVFTQGVYDAGAQAYFDAVCCHPYTNKDGLMSGSLWQAVEQIRPIMDSYGDNTKPLWGTETGTPTAGNDGPWMAESAQAQLVTDTFAYWRAIPQSGPLFWYTLSDMVGPTTEDNFGLIRVDGSHKPAYDVLRLLQ